MIIETNDVYLSIIPQGTDFNEMIKSDQFHLQNSTQIYRLQFYRHVVQGGWWDELSKQKRAYISLDIL